MTAATRVRPSRTPRSVTCPRLGSIVPEPYDLSLVYANKRVEAAQADMARVIGTPEAMFVWMRKASYERALHAQEQGLHHIHRVISDVGTACTCGRVVPLDAARDPLNQPGHIDRSLREIWVVPTVLREIPPRGSSECVRLHCSRCAWSATPSSARKRRLAGRLHLLRRHPLLLLHPRRQPQELS